MKKRRIFALLMAACMVCMVMISCATSTPRVKVNATFSVVINGETLVDAHTIELEGTTESAPTVLESICAVLEGYGMIPEYDEDSLEAVTYDGTTYAAEDGNAWYYTINGADGSKAGSTYLNEGDNIVYIYGSIS
ncbi:MAG: hypothetical protein E7638_07885 [Ruminococcaceae bacterium]|nr:hypothetical protein [Oscillospiraceae bacterium]